VGQTRHVITEILLKVELNTMNPNPWVRQVLGSITFEVANTNSPPGFYW